MRRWFLSLSVQQQLFVGACGVLLIALLPELLTVGAVGVERAIVGVLIAIERLLLSVLQKVSTAGLALGAIAIAGYGVYAFVFNRK